MLLIITNIIQSHKYITRSKTTLVFPLLTIWRVTQLTLRRSLFTLTIVQWTINLHYCVFDNRKIDYAERCMSL